MTRVQGCIYIDVIPCLEDGVNNTLGGAANGGCVATRMGGQQGLSFSTQTFQNYYTGSCKHQDNSYGARSLEFQGMLVGGNDDTN